MLALFSACFLTFSCVRGMHWKLKMLLIFLINIVKDEWNRVQSLKKKGQNKNPHQFTRYIFILLSGNLPDVCRVLCLLPRKIVCAHWFAGSVLDPAQPRETMCANPWGASSWQNIIPDWKDWKGKQIWSVWYIIDEEEISKCNCFVQS